MRRVVEFFLAVSLLFAAAAFAACESEHIHDYHFQTLSPATCKSEGVEEGICSECGDRIEKKIPKKEHEFSEEFEIVQESTCKESGQKRYICKNCGEEKLEALPLAEHDFRGKETVINPTCTEKGERRVKCLNCDEEKVTILSALNHSFDGGVVEKSPTCEEEGSIKYTCTRCDEEKTEPIASLGHIFGDFIVDRPSSLTEDGEKSRHCLREGCSAREDITVLKKGEEVSFTFKAVNQSGREYPFPEELQLDFYEDGSLVFSRPYKSEEITIKFRPYEVKLSGLRKGYSQAEEVTLSRNSVDLKILLKASLIENERESRPERVLGEGDVMYDFTVRDIDTPEAEQKKLSELLKGKKGAYLYFFYVGCGACSSQFPVFTKALEAFGGEDEILVLMINVYADTVKGQTKAEMKEYAKKYPDWVMMASGELKSSNLFDWTDRPYDAVPFSFFLDEEGVIFRLVEADSASNLNKIYQAVLKDLLKRELPLEKVVYFKKKIFVIGG